MIKGKVIKDCVYHYDGVPIYYDVYFSVRRSISIQVRGKDKRVIVKLPIGENLRRAERFISEKSDWIVKSMSKIDESYEKMPIRDYSNGSSHLLLGAPYTLIVESGGVNRLIEQGDSIKVTTTSPKNVEVVIKKWYHKKALEYIVPIFSDMSFKFGEKHKIVPKSLEFKHVKSFWGVCTSKGIVRINIDLVRAPKKCIEFIIAHELCHLIHLNHSVKFYELLTEEMPDWKERKKLLDTTISSRR